MALSVVGKVLQALLRGARLLAGNPAPEGLKLPQSGSAAGCAGLLSDGKLE